MIDNSKTIVTCCDKNFIWAFYLLLASLRKFNVNVKVNAVIRGLTDGDKSLFMQFGNVELFETSDRKHMNLLKPEAILTADTEYITWIDADSITTGNITKYLTASEESFQIKFRGKGATARLYKTYFGTIEKDEIIPKIVLDIWQKDVGENDLPAIETTCSTECFVLHRRHLAFIRKWQTQMEKATLYRGHLKNIPNRKSIAYHMMDEPILNSLFAFAHNPPPISEYLLDKDPEASIVHFADMPKPWQMWRLEHLKYFDLVISIIQWAQGKGYRTPPIPWSFKRRNKILCYIFAYIHKLLLGIKFRLCRRIYKP